MHRHECGDSIDIFFDADQPFLDSPISKQLQNNVAFEALFKKIFSIWITKGEGYYHKCLSILYDILFEIEKKQYLT